jgi:hypothetical protein
MNTDPQHWLRLELLKFSNRKIVQYTVLGICIELLSPEDFSFKAGNFASGFEGIHKKCFVVVVFVA